MDYLGNAGWKSTAQNAALKAKYETDKSTLADLEHKLDTITKAASGAPSAGAVSTTKPPPAAAGKGTPPDSAMVLQKQADHLKSKFAGAEFRLP